ncbi:MAG: MarR family winged helix-turn-helix transcriptional regulator [Selenomonas sp.]|uniref:MarR family winged helix-turn-helix transcriptional regulator n=1 Tax=uncultured Selenomonas sp. TaxID=159275 RepID=UPI0026015D52|nr:MarR family winged helix-turn-helix transcriptional regulator [uncultured Selenomonas sp.]MDD6126543.1 MarR family winged helix-turn-helix transcriptional regulator [Veillonellaceae bacterium]MDD6698007.1 MarR family winged helix-turn-helix transcriptional regulator [Veillonellaceae bacterium]MDY6350280.1 MarR family winged helix-turn-helix transcriptional regulator [Selenomonas sp.]
MKRPEHAESWREDDCFCLRLKRASEELMKAYMGALAPSGVTPVQHMILGKIHVCKGATLCEIAEAIGVDRSTLARTIKPLVKEGYVLDARPAGARNCRLMLTEKGEQTFRQAHQLWEQEQDRVAAGLGKNGLSVFASFLQMMAGV